MCWPQIDFNCLAGHILHYCDQVFDKLLKYLESKLMIATQHMGGRCLISRESFSLIVSKLWTVCVSIKSKLLNWLSAYPSSEISYNARKIFLKKDFSWYCISSWKMELTGIMQRGNLEPVIFILLEKMNKTVHCF